VNSSPTNGTVAISPFGPNMRSIIVTVDPQKLLNYNLKPVDVMEALAKGNTIIPAGNIYIKDSMPIIANNATIVDIQKLGDIPLRIGRNVYLRDIATIQDSTDITYGYALVNGKKSVYLPIIKKDTGSTLTVVADVHKSMQLFRDAVPPDVTVNFEFDESPTVVAAVKSVATEGLIGATLTGLMILLFLRDLRSVIVVVANIPLALLGSLPGLWITGNTINIMSLGGMALAIGNVNFFYGGAGFTWAPSGPNYFYQPTPGGPLLPSPQFQFSTDMIFQPLHDRQALNSARWDLQTAKNDALFMTAKAYFNVHRYRGLYAVSIDAVQRGRQLVGKIATLKSDLIPRVEVDRARNLLAGLEQKAVVARQDWRIASADLTRVLRLDPRAVVEPLEHDHLQITLIAPGRSLDELIPIALTNRPELASQQATVQAMLVSIRQEKLRPLIPALYLNGFQTPYELIQAGALGEGQGGKVNQWSARNDISSQLMITADGMGFRNLAKIKGARGMSSQALVELFRIQDSVAAGVTRTQADLQSAAARVVQAEREVKSALINYNGNVEGLEQTKRFGNVLIQVFRPQEVVFALQLLMRAYEHYIDTVADYNTAQFAMFRELGYPAREIAFTRRAGEVLPVNTQRPDYLPPVGAGPPPATR